LIRELAGGMSPVNKPFDDTLTADVLFGHIADLWADTMRHSVVIH